MLVGNNKFVVLFGRFTEEDSPGTNYSKLANRKEGSGQSVWVVQVQGDCKLNWSWVGAPPSLDVKWLTLKTAQNATAFSRVPYKSFVDGFKHPLFSFNV